MAGVTLSNSLVLLRLQGSGPWSSLVVALACIPVGVGSGPFLFLSLSISARKKEVGLPALGSGSTRERTILELGCDASLIAASPRPARGAARAGEDEPENGTSGSWAFFSQSNKQSLVS
jgi:hypothetical protein